jgi:hypothetical protein
MLFKTTAVKYGVGLQVLVIFPRVQTLMLRFISVFRDLILLSSLLQRTLFVVVRFSFRFTF